MKPSRPLVLAVPKGRIAEEFQPLLRKIGVRPEAAFDDPHARQLRFKTDLPDMEIIRVRAFDVAMFVSFGGADLGVCGSDVLHESDDTEIYAPLDLGIGLCRLSICRLDAADLPDPRRSGQVRVATKYPVTTRAYYAAAGVQASCVNLSGAMELAPTLGLADYIVDLVATGATLRANRMVEAETIAQVSSRLVVNRVKFKTDGARLRPWIDRFEGIAHARPAA
ncbi:MAG: ATP phosphoribosyltransferase [Alphaproteobacteria bacterium]